MSATILNGRDIAKELREKIKSEVFREAKALGRRLKLTTIRIGNFEDAKLYEQMIGRLLEVYDIEHDIVALNDAVSSGGVEVVIHQKVNDLSVAGILLLSPITKNLSYEALLGTIPPIKDAEGTRHHSGDRHAEAYPPTAQAILELILASGIQIAGKEAVVVGRSQIVGRPAAELLVQENATVTICHSKTNDLAGHVSRADIVVAATGKPNLIRGAWIKPGAVVVDAGESVVDGKPVGDVEFEKAKERAGFITPVPSGVGPITSVMLVKNLLTLSRRSRSRA
jgi:methylenetetrahydrofolate dehydrogenase (NADP+)/methenyltetrahydrofolate cyclohydrolase